MLLLEILYQDAYDNNDSNMNDPKATRLYWISAVLGCLGTIPYAISNWLMASRYDTISYEMPYVLQDKQIPLKKC